MSFSNKLPQDTRRRISSALGIKEVLSHDKYLGLPTLFKRSKKISFTGIKDRIWKKLQGWKEKLLSKAGKEVLIKAVAQSIPTYAMSCFRLPSSFCDDVERIVRNFWWGTTTSERGIPWKAWKDVCRPKCDGGMGFRDLKVFNSSLLAKQLWRLHCFPNSLLARSLQACYYPSSSIWETKVGFNPSYAWRSIWSSRSVLELGVRWRVGDGRSIKIWKDAWLDGDGTGKLITPVRVLDQDDTVDKLMDSSNHMWCPDIVNEVLFPIDAERVMNIPISSTGVPDMRVWIASTDGLFRVKDAYSLALNAQFDTSSSNGSDPMWNKLWSLKIQPKAKVFLWRAAWDILPHGHNLRKKGVENVGSCGRCGMLETNSHVLKDCLWARNLWKQVMNLSDIPTHGSFRDWLGSIMSNRSIQEVELFRVCAWQIWCARNDLCFEKLYVSLEYCYLKARDMLSEYKQASLLHPQERNRRVDVKWSPPNVESVKVNVDAAINLVDNKFRIGVVARDSNVSVAVCICGKIRTGSVPVGCASHQGIDLEFSYSRR